MPESAITVDPMPPTWWRLGPALWLMSLVILMAVYLAFNLPGTWFGGAAVQNFSGSAMIIATGSGRMEGTRLVVTGPDSKNAVVLALAIPQKIPTQEYGVIALDVEGMPDTADVQVFWRNDFSPDKIFTRSLSVAGGRVKDTLLAGDSNWLGRVFAVGLIVRGELARPLTVNGIAIRPASAATLLNQRWQDWMHRETWSGVSLSRIVGGRTGMDLPLPLLSGVTVLVACCGYWALRRWRHWPSSPLTIAAILMCGWLILDLRWQWNLGSDALASWINFAGKDLSSKRLAGVDEELEKIAIDVRGFLTKGARVFVIAQDPVTTGRLAYLLLPATIYYNTAQTSLPAPEQFKPGDLMLVHRKPGIRYSPDRKEFLWENQFRVRAEIIYFDKGGTVLARIL